MENIFDFSPKKLAHRLLQWREPVFRTNQVIEAAWMPGRKDFSDATSLSKTLRNKLNQTFQIPVPLLPAQQLHDSDGTQKILLDFTGDAQVECVAIPKDGRLTYCLSTQVGCGMGCKFCATAHLGLIRNLSPGEIIAQIRALNALTGRTPSNLVFMGMGEPLHNLIGLRSALSLITHPKAMNWSHQKTMVSTCGYVPGISAIAKEPLPAKLAVSLNAADNETRSRLMPINRQFPLEILMPAIGDYIHKTQQTVSIEYILLGNINDKPQDALLLGKLLKKYNVKINIIPYNRSHSNLVYQPPSEKRITEFLKIVRNSGILTTLRHSRGQDIQAACGQLAGQIKRSKK